MDTSRLQIKRPRIRSLLVMALLTVIALLVPANSVRANGYYVPFAYIGTSTGACSSGRTCVNVKTVNSCGGTGNYCAVWNATGDAYDAAFVSPTSTYSAIYTSGERIYNNNSGTQRAVCGFRYTDYVGTYGIAYYGAGWTPMPFTGVKSMLAPSVIGSCV